MLGRARGLCRKRTYRQQMQSNTSVFGCLRTLVQAGQLGYLCHFCTVSHSYPCIFANVARSGALAVGRRALVTVLYLVIVHLCPWPICVIQPSLRRLITGSVWSDFRQPRLRALGSTVELLARNRCHQMSLQSNSFLENKNDFDCYVKVLVEYFNSYIHFSSAEKLLC